MVTAVKLKAMLLSDMSLIEVMVKKCKSDFESCIDMEYDWRDPESVFWLEQMKYFIDALSIYSGDIRYLKKRVKAEGLLHKGLDGNYWIGNTCIYHHETIEINVERVVTVGGCNHKTRAWVRDGIISYLGKDQFLVHEDLNIEGTRARVRET